jgi:hypothetical protein
MARRPLAFVETTDLDDEDKLQEFIDTTIEARRRVLDGAPDEEPDDEDGDEPFE